MVLPSTHAAALHFILPSPKCPLENDRHFVQVALERAGCARNQWPLSTQISIFLPPRVWGLFPTD
jgi:hypothetical protein